MTIGQRIKSRREQLNIGQSELAEKVGVSKQTLYKYENDIVTNIPSDKVEKISYYLETTPAYLMGWEENESNINEIAGQIYTAYAYRVLYDSLPVEEQDKISEIEKKLVSISPENRTLILNLLKSLLPDA